MTLREIINTNRDMFYRQEWYLDEPFMDKPMPEDIPSEPPSGVQYVGMPLHTLGVPIALGDLYPASVLAFLYVLYPEDPIWKRYLWTADTDKLGQQVYVGDNGKGLEIHRHLHLTDRWAVPTWD